MTEWPDEPMRVVGADDEVGPGFLIAAGGWCAPSSSFYDTSTAKPEIDWDDVDWERVRYAYDYGYDAPGPTELWDLLQLPKISVPRGNLHEFWRVQLETTLEEPHGPEHRNDPGRARWWRARPGRRRP